MNEKSLLNKIYSEKDSEKAYHAIQACIKKYEKNIIDDFHTISQKDVVLISYGDQLISKKETCIKTLNCFVDKYFNPEINTIHILPFYPYTTDDGFSVVDYKKVEKKLGNWNDIKEFTKNYRLMFDAVINHISRSSDWFQRFINEDNGYNSFFINVSPTTDLSAVVRPRSFPLLTKFKAKTGKKLHIWTTFSEDQVDLNFKNYKVLIAILDVLLFYISKGAKLIRLDAVGFLWKDIGTSCIHLPEVHYIIQLFRLIIDKLAPNVMLVTETNVPHEENISYFGNGKNEAQMVYNFTLPPLLAYSIHKQNTEKLTKWANTLQLPGKKTCFFNFTASHDGIGVRPLTGILPSDEIGKFTKKSLNYGGYVSYKNNNNGTKSPYEINCNYFDFLSYPSENEEVKIKRFILSQAVMLAMPGIPGIYFHSLVGSRNDRIGAEKSKIRRRINREKLSFTSLSRELEDKNSIRHKIYNSYKKILRIRTNEPFFHPYGDFSFPKIDHQIFAIERRLNEKSNHLLTLFNFSDQTKKINLKAHKWVCIFSRKKIVQYIELEAFGFAWIKSQ